MKSKLGYVGSYNAYKGKCKVYFFPSDYTKEKYIIFPNYLNFSSYYRFMKSLPVILLENEIDVEDCCKELFPYGLNIFLRENIYRAIKDGLCEKPIRNSLKEMQYYEEITGE